MTTALALAIINQGTQSTALAELSSETPFFKPVNTNALASLFGEFDEQSTDIKDTVAFLQDKHQALSTLAKANLNTLFGTVNLMQQEPALKYLTAQFWQKALNLTDAYDFMPQAKRKEWNDLIESCDTPDFTIEAVIPTLRELLSLRERFLAETVDGIFQSLSGDHVTNQPMGFSKRMIMPSKFGTGESEPTSDVIGYVSDLRSVVGFLMGRKGVGLKDTEKQIDFASRHYGKWVDVDGGAVRLKVHKVGTVHLELHPDMAWRLNQILAILYPMAIPPKARKRPKYTAKVRPLQHNLISGEALRAIANMENPTMHDPRAPEWMHDRRLYDKTLFCLEFKDSHVKKPPAYFSEVHEIMVACGGAPEKSEAGMPGYRFDYDFETLRETLVLMGSIPEQRSHQFYHTQENEAKRAVSWCAIEPGMDCLEPSAGQGHIAQYMPADTQCVEISKVQSAILQAKGFKVDNADFLEWAKSAGNYDRIVMNPPYTDSQAKEHVQAAAELLKHNGKLVAILPASLKNTTLVDGLQHEWSEVIDNAFVATGTNVSVIMLRLSKGNA
tara:strand:+ start:3536 stop:5203 length:1668 start_codon:yes stop_codon:yes gene_type:complete